MMIRKGTILYALALLMSVNAYSQSLHLTKQEEKTLSEHRNEISTHAAFLSEDAFAGISSKYKFHAQQSAQLRRYCDMRELKKYIHNYLETDSQLRYTEKERIDSVFQDSINAILIPYNHQISGPTISLALLMSESLKVSKKHQEKLMNKALDFARRLKKNPYTDIKKEEISILRKNLTAKQLETVIDEKNNVQAQVKAKRAWEALEQAGVSRELDSLPQVTRAHLYYLIEMRYWDLYVGDNEVRDHNLQDLYRNKPKIIKMYEALDEKKRIQEKKEKSVGVEYSW